MKIIAHIGYKLYLGEDNNQYKSNKEIYNLFNSDNLPKYEINIETGEITEIDYNDYLDDIKIKKVETIKETAKNILESLDWKCIRHRDQTDNAETTSLTAEEYTALLNYKKLVRDWSNTKETEINNTTTLKELNAVDLEDYPAQ